MAHDSNLPCDGDGACMICLCKPPESETLTCKTCVTPWHVDCLSVRPQTLADVASWECPDCNQPFPSAAPASPLIAPAGRSESSRDLVAAIRAIESDESLTDHEKAKRRQALLSGCREVESAENTDANEKKKEIIGGGGILDLLDGNFNCSFCMQLPDRPVTTPCGHNFCLKCFQKWIGQGRHTCANCRAPIPSKMSSQPRINSTLVMAIRMAKLSKSTTAGGLPKVYHYVQNENRPDKAYTTERAKKAGKANACSGKIFVTVPPDHFGPILAENDPERNQGVLVGETWEDRMECRQWGAHLPHVAGIAGQSEYGAQSVALSGGYEDDEDHGEWFLYTGSGGRDLSGNKRTNKMQSFDQKFEKMNEALRVSCRKGYPVRVVRSHKEKRSSYAPEKGVRYDGIYRIEKCWRKAGIQGFKVCRYLFVRCDNDPAPWTSDDYGDRPRPLPMIKELKDATDVTERKGAPSWDFDEEKCCWMWKKPPPESRRQTDIGYTEDGNSTRKPRRQSQAMSVREKLLKEFSCLICRKVMVLPLTTPCAHNFCKACLEGTFVGQSFIRQRTVVGGRALRAQKNIMKCPTCSNDIAEFLQNPQVNREMMSMISALQQQTKEEESAELGEETDGKNLDSNEDISVTDEKIKETDGDGKSDVAVEMEVCNINSEAQKLEESEEVIKDSPAKLKPQDPCKEKKAEDDERCPQNFDSEKDLSKVDVVELDLSDSKEELQAAQGNETRRSSKRGKAGDEMCISTQADGVKARSKKLKLVEDA